jgi:hypothetical protein
LTRASAAVRPPSVHQLVAQLLVVPFQICHTLGKLLLHALDRSGLVLPVQGITWER